MGDTNIEWTDKVWNCVTGCTKVSAGCKNCYAERMFHRPYPGRAFTDVQCHPERLDQPRHWRKPCRIFVNSISDLFHEVIPDRFITEIFQAMRGSPQHTFQILTKRPAQMHELLARVKRWEGWYTLDGEEPKGYRGNAAIMGDDENWPLPNVWLGVSVEDQKTADERIPLLLKTPAKVRFVSYEPTLGPLDFQKVPVIHDPDCECNPEYMCASFPGRWCAVCGHAASQHLADGSNCCCASCPDHEWEEGQRGIGVDWVIAGSESGPEARRYDLEWFRSMRDQCKVAGTSFFMKQITLKGRKISMHYWPKDLRVREFPHVEASAGLH